MSQEVHARDTGAVRVITIDRPQRRNALDMDSRRELIRLLHEADADPAVRAVVLTGAGGTFSAGGDIATMTTSFTPAEAAERVSSMSALARAVVEAGTPVVAAVEGTAFGAGLALALACDVVVAADDARFGAAFTGIGLAADAGILYSLPQRVGPAVARRMLLLGESVTGPAARDLGLVDDLVAPGEALERAVAVAGRLAGGAPLALAALKRVFAAPPDGFEAAFAAEETEQTALLLSADFAEGITAFREKRRPRFEGH